MKLTAISYNDFNYDVKERLVEGAREAIEALEKDEVVVKHIIIGGEQLFAHYDVDSERVYIVLLTTESVIAPHNEVIVQTPDDVGYGDFGLEFDDGGSVSRFDLYLPNDYTYSLLNN